MPRTVAVTRRLLLLDYGGVLVQSPLERVRQYASRYGVNASDAVRIVFGEQGDKGWAPWKLLEKGEISYAEYRRFYEESRLAEGHPLPCPSLDEIYSLEPNKSLLSLLYGLNRTACVVGIATNNIAEMRSVWREQVDASSFAVVFDSSAIGYRKPEPEFYEHIALYAASQSVLRSSIWLIDDVEANVVAARAAGFNGLVAAGEFEAVNRQVQTLLASLVEN